MPKKTAKTKKKTTKKPYKRATPKKKVVFPYVFTFENGWNLSSPLAMYPGVGIEMNIVEYIGIRIREVGLWCWLMMSKYLGGDHGRK